MEVNYGKTARRHECDAGHSRRSPITTPRRHYARRQQIITALRILQQRATSRSRRSPAHGPAPWATRNSSPPPIGYAVDYDGDGKRDIWYDVPDALASTASYLKHSNWQAGQSWGYEVTLPKGFNPKKVSEKTLRRLGDWQKLGITRVGGEPFPRPRRQGWALRSSWHRGPRLPRAQQFLAPSSATTRPPPMLWGSGICPTG